MTDLADHHAAVGRSLASSYRADCKCESCTKHRLALVDLTIGAFVGEITLKSTGQPVICDVCLKDRAMWQHAWKPKQRPKDARENAYLCFGCGDH